MKNYILTVILACTSLILQAQTSTGKHHIKYLDINTGNSDYGVDFIDNNKVVFTAATSERVSNSSKYQAHLDLFEGEVGEEGEIINKSRNTGIISKRITKTGASFTNDKKTVYFTAKKYVKRKPKNPIKSKIFKAEINESGVWINIEKLSINKKNYTIENPTLNKEENKVYFSSDLPSTIGGKDIFVSDIKEDGTLGEPRNLGDKVNTQKDEITPFIADNNFLYFSSNGRDDSIGNFDIYTSEAFENIVSEPLHLDSPINSINNDFAYIVNSDKGYFSSNRLQGQKNNDIYSFYIEPDKPIVCLQEIVGTVRDKETESLLAEAIISVIDDEGEEIKTLTTDEKGNYKFSLDCKSTFTIRATKAQYSEEEHIVNTANYLTAPPLEVNQGLSKDLISTENNKVSIKVNPIYFRFDKSDLNNKAKIELDKIVKVMKENGSLIVEAASHTDSRGTAAYNQKLSERRSQASVDYIVSKGIDESRIKSKGYGESQLLNNCSSGVRCTNDQHQFNRRTEFIIINKQVLSNPKQSLNTSKTVAVSEVEPEVNNSIKENYHKDKVDSFYKSPSISKKKK
jgi:outer membrane protein OmpA-like peptidoglycan-associated protein